MDNELSVSIKTQILESQPLKPKMKFKQYVALLSCKGICFPSQTMHSIYSVSFRSPINSRGYKQSSPRNILYSKLAINASQGTKDQKGASEMTPYLCTKLLKIYNLYRMLRFVEIQTYQIEFGEMIKEKAKSKQMRNFPSNHYNLGVLEFGVNQEYLSIYFLYKYSNIDILKYIPKTNLLLHFNILSSPTLILFSIDLQDISIWVCYRSIK